MEAITLILSLLAAVVVSGFLARTLPLAIPRPLLQIAFGAVIGLVSDFSVELDPEVFFLLFLPPLLFLDGWRIPKDEMLKDGKVILELALGLVIFTVFGLGLLIHWMLPLMPLPVAFALAAIISPTDPIAVSAIAQRVPIPKRLMHILEGESLLNDASGLVCFRFAVAAAMTGGFSAGNAALTFLWLVSGGIAIGFAVAYLVTVAKGWSMRHFGEETGSQILISLLIPFAAYLLAEHADCSGILAAVAAGVTMTYAERPRQQMAATRIQRTAVWDMIQFAANGAIFVLLGEQLPLILARAAETMTMKGHEAPWRLALYVLGITLALAVLRFFWVWISLNLTHWQAKRRGETRQKPPLRLLAATSLAGVKGAVTLAGILTLPEVLPDGTPFPTRELAIFLAMGVILVSLLLASMALPLLLRGLEMPAEPSREMEEDRARIAASQAAITALQDTQASLSAGRQDPELYLAATSRIMDHYRRRIESRTGEGDDQIAARRTEMIERELILVAIRAERDAILRLARRAQIGSETARHLTRELDLAEERWRTG